jgi:Sec-independent protein translocase protein TatA
MKYAWLLVFLVFLLLLILYLKSAPNANNYVGSFIQTFKNETKTSKWYFLGKIKIEAGKIIWFNWAS